MLVTPICVLWQTVKTQINAVWSSLFAKTKVIVRERNTCTTLLEVLTCYPFMYTMDHPKFIVSSEKEETIGS